MIGTHTAEKRTTLPGEHEISVTAVHVEMRVIDSRSCSNQALRQNLTSKYPPLRARNFMTSLITINSIYPWRHIFLVTRENIACCDTL